MSLRTPPAFSLPMVGEGDVLHLGEATEFKFRLRRVTPSLLVELGLPFTLRELCLDAHDEEAQLAAADLRAHPPGQPS